MFSISKHQSKYNNGSILLYHFIAGTCLEKIYVYAFTSNLRYAETNTNHEIEVIGATQRKKIRLPNRPNDYTLHKGDMWKLDIVQDFGFFRGTCLRYGTAASFICIHRSWQCIAMHTNIMIAWCIAIAYSTC